MAVKKTGIPSMIESPGTYGANGGKQWGGLDNLKSGGMDVIDGMKLLLSLPRRSQKRVWDSLLRENNH